MVDMLALPRIGQRSTLLPSYWLKKIEQSRNVAGAVLPLFSGTSVPTGYV